MFIANLITRCFVLVFDAPSYAINILVAKPMAVAATFFFFIHTLLKLNYKKSLSSHLSGHKHFAEYTRRILSNIRSYGGVCIMQTTIVRVVSVIVWKNYACLCQSFLADHTKAFNGT